MSTQSNGSDIERAYWDAGFPFMDSTETSHHGDDDFLIVIDEGVGEGRSSVEGRIIGRDGTAIEVELHYRKECCHFGDEWHVTFEGTVDEVVHACGMALTEDGQKPT